MTALERALNNIGRDDVVEKCNFAEICHYPLQNGVYAEPEKHQSNQTAYYCFDIFLDLVIIKSNISTHLLLL